MSYKGYFHRILLVDLSSGTSRIWQPPSALWEQFLGGKGAGLKILHDHGLEAGPLSPQNPLIFLTGPVTGSPIPTSARSCVVFLSPLTGSAVDSHAGGHFGPALRRLGLDGVIVLGRAERPVYLEVRAERAILHPAEGLWGQGIFATEKALKERHPGAEVASIGPAGENKVRFACVGTGLWRQFGRGGAGAVMGAKNLKAIVIPPGQEKVPLADEAAFHSLNRKLVQDLLAHPIRKKREELGTTMWIRMAQEAGFLPTRNFRECRFPGFEGITSEAMRRELSWEPRGCFNCPIRCGKLARWNGFELEGPEYETTAFLGANLAVGDARAVAYANWLCDDLGLDTISTGVVISFALEAGERGLLPLSQRFGDAEGVFTLIRQIALREGAGDLLAEGTRIAAEALGEEAKYFAIQVGGMELSGVNPKGCASMGLSLATADFASHTRFWSATAEMQGALTVDSVPKFVKEGQDEVAARNSLIVCDFLPFGFDRLAPLFSALTGMVVAPEDLLRTGERIENLHRLVNLARGRREDTLPERFFSEPHEAGLFAGRRFTRPDFQRWLKEYYQLRGWDAEGRPTPEKLAELGLPGEKFFTL
ncbi:MAG: aldehyde ferredoxin oxidoreductase family protein [Candidatus Bipolaricaulaceae bacterium]